MSWLEVPSELRTLIVVQLDYSDILNYLEGTDDPLREDRYLWSLLAERDLGVSEFEFNNPHEVEAVIPTTASERYLQIVSRDRIVRGSEQFRALGQCCHGAIMENNMMLLDYFLDLFDKGKAQDWSLTSSLMKSAFQAGRPDLVDRFEARAPGFSYSNQELTIQAAIAGRLDLLRKIRRIAHIMSEDVLTGLIIGGSNLDYRNRNALEAHLYVNGHLDLDDVLMEHRGLALGLEGDMDKITRARDQNLIGAQAMGPLLTQGLKRGQEDLVLFALERLDRQFVHQITILMGSRPSYFLSMVLDRIEEKGIKLIYGVDYLTGYLYNDGLRDLTTAQFINGRCRKRQQK